MLGFLFSLYRVERKGLSMRAINASDVPIPKMTLKMAFGMIFSGGRTSCTMEAVAGKMTMVIVEETARLVTNDTLCASNHFVANALNSSFDKVPDLSISHLLSVSSISCLVGLDVTPGNWSDSLAYN